jgi:hypothetical protein
MSKKKASQSGRPTKLSTVIKSENMFGFIELIMAQPLSVFQVNSFY